MSDCCADIQSLLGRVDNTEQQLKWSQAAIWMVVGAITGGPVGAIWGFDAGLISDNLDLLQSPPPATLASIQRMSTTDLRGDESLRDLYSEYLTVFPEGIDSWLLQRANNPFDILGISNNAMKYPPLFGLDQLMEMVGDPEFNWESLTPEHQQAILDQIDVIIGANFNPLWDDNHDLYDLIQDIKGKLPGLLVQNQALSQNPNFEALLRETLATDYAGQANFLESLALIPPETFVTIGSLLETIDPDQFSSLVQNPFLLSSLANSAMLPGEGADFYNATVAAPELVAELANSPFLTGVISEIFTADTVQQILAEQLFTVTNGEDRILFDQAVEEAVYRALNIVPSESGQGYQGESVEPIHPLEQMRAELQAEIDEVKTEFNVVKASAVEASIAATASAGASIASALSAARAAAAAERAEAAANSKGTSDSSKRTADSPAITRPPRHVCISED